MTFKVVGENIEDSLGTKNKGSKYKRSPYANHLYIYLPCYDENNDIFLERKIFQILELLNIQTKLEKLYS